MAPIAAPRSPGPRCEARAREGGETCGGSDDEDGGTEASQGGDEDRSALQRRHPIGPTRGNCAMTNREQCLSAGSVNRPLRRRGSVVRAKMHHVASRIGIGLVNVVRSVRRNRKPSVPFAFLPDGPACVQKHEIHMTFGNAERDLVSFRSERRGGERSLRAPDPCERVDRQQD